MYATLQYCSPLSAPTVQASEIFLLEGKNGDRIIRILNTVLFNNKACRESFVLPSTVGLNDKKFSWLRSQTSLSVGALPSHKAHFFVYSLPASLQMFLLLPPCFPFLAAFNRLLIWTHLDANWTPAFYLQFAYFQTAFFPVFGLSGNRDLLLSRTALLL